MNTIEQLVELYQDAHRTLEEVLGEVTPEEAHWLPPGRALPIDALYAHTVIGEDMFLSLFFRKAPALCATTWSGRVGVSELPPNDPPWDAWARDVKVDLPALREYARAVYAASEEYVRSLCPEALEAPFEAPPPGVSWSFGYVLGPLIAGHAYQHAGEISAIKGLQGLTGYAF